MITDLKKNLIYDVGCFDGADTALYLKQGYRVIAIEAHPQYVAQLSNTFASEIAEGRLTLLNVAVAEFSGCTEFWLSEIPGWSSLNRGFAAPGARAITVECVRFDTILSEYGVPYYLKVDIEGSDHLCLDALRNCEHPIFVSVESECSSEFDTPAETESLRTLNLLHELGYRHFKLINQVGWKSAGPTEPSQYKPKRSISSRDLKFGATGYWGEDLAGTWMNFETARSVYLNAKQRHIDLGKPPHHFWYDWHATTHLSSKVEACDYNVGEI